MKIKHLASHRKDSMFALLCGFVCAHINGTNKATSATRFYAFLDTSGAPLLAIALIPILRQLFRDCSLEIRLGWLLIAGGTLLGLILIKIGTPSRFRTWLYLHIALRSEEHTSELQS